MLKTMCGHFQGPHKLHISSYLTLVFDLAYVMGKTMFIKLYFWRSELNKVRDGEKPSKAETQREEKERGRGREREG